MLIVFWETNHGETSVSADSYSKVVCGLFGEIGTKLNNRRLTSSLRSVIAHPKLNKVNIFLQNPSLHLLITTSSHDSLEGNHLNCLKLDLITANVMILIKMLFSLLDVYVNVCMRMSSDVVFTVRAHEHKASHLKTSEQRLR